MPGERERQTSDIRVTSNESLQLMKARNAPRGGVDHACCFAAELWC